MSLSLSLASLSLSLRPVRDSTWSGSRRIAAWNARCAAPCSSCPGILKLLHTGIILVVKKNLVQISRIDGPTEHLSHTLAAYTLATIRSRLEGALCRPVLLLQYQKLTKFDGGLLSPNLKVRQSYSCKYLTFFDFPTPQLPEPGVHQYRQYCSPNLEGPTPQTRKSDFDFETECPAPLSSTLMQSYFETSLLPGQ